MSDTRIAGIDQEVADIDGQISALSGRRAGLVRRREALVSKASQKSIISSVKKRRMAPDLDPVFRIIADLHYDHALWKCRQVLRGNSREQAHVEQRRCFIYLASVGMGASMVEVGQALKRDHTTILYNMKRISDRQKGLWDQVIEILIKPCAAVAA